MRSVLSGSSRWWVEHGSMLQVLPLLPEMSLDACICDPPYELGFMGRTWDRSGIAFLPETWAAILRVLKPGAHLLAFGGTRTAHRIACAIEDAGFEIRDSIAWTFGSGFPKSLDVSKAIDAAAGAERPVVGERVLTGSAALSTDEKGGTYAANTESSGRTKTVAITAPATEEAKAWEGFGTALKPAHEPIILARRPIDGTVAENVLRYGTGGLNIDGCRVPTAAGDDKSARIGHSQKTTKVNVFGPQRMHAEPDGMGRWPPNLLITHSASCRKVGTREVKAHPTWDTPNRECESGFTGEEVSRVRHANGRDGEPSADRRYAEDGRDFSALPGRRRDDETETVDVFECAQDCPVRLMDEQSGNAGGGFGISGVDPNAGLYNKGFPRGDRRQVGFGDSGGASRFFPRLEWDPEVDNFDPFFYCAKAARAERDLGLDGFEPVSGGEATHREDGSAGTRSPRAGAGRNGGARNTHPCVKPIALMRWLCRLVTPPGGIVLDPFCGSGSTGIAALLEGFRFLGIEKNDTHEEPFVSIARARIQHVTGGQHLPETAPLRPRKDQRQGALF